MHRPDGLDMVSRSLENTHGHYGLLGIIHVTFGLIDTGNPLQLSYQLFLIDIWGEDYYLQKTLQKKIFKFY